MRNNKGITLIELIIAVGILTIVGGAVASLIIVALKNYSGASAETGLQYEAQLVSNQMQEMIIDSSRGVTYSYSYNETSGSSHEEIVKSDAAITGTDASGASISVTGKSLYIYNASDYYCLRWDKAAKTLTLIQYAKTVGNTSTDIASSGDERERAVLSDIVGDFRVDLSQIDSEHSVEYTLTFVKEGTGRTYTTTNKVKLRNVVAVNHNMTQIYEKDDLAVVPKKIIIQAPTVPGSSTGNEIVKSGNNYYVWMDKNSAGTTADRLVSLNAVTVNSNDDVMAGVGITWKMEAENGGLIAASTKLEGSVLTLGASQFSPIKVSANTKKSATENLYPIGTGTTAEEAPFIKIYPMQVTDFTFSGSASRVNNGKTEVIKLFDKLSGTGTSDLSANSLRVGDRVSVKLDSLVMQNMVSGLSDADKKDFLGEVSVKVENEGEANRYLAAPITTTSLKMGDSLNFNIKSAADWDRDGVITLTLTSAKNTSLKRTLTFKVTAPKITAEYIPLQWRTSSKENLSSVLENYTRYMSSSSGDVSVYYQSGGVNEGLYWYEFYGAQLKYEEANIKNRSSDKITFRISDAMVNAGHVTIGTFVFRKYDTVAIDLTKQQRDEALRQWLNEKGSEITGQRLRGMLALEIGKNNISSSWENPSIMYFPAPEYSLQDKIFFISENECFVMRREGEWVSVWNGYRYQYQYQYRYKLYYYMNNEQKWSKNYSDYSSTWS